MAGFDTILHGHLGLDERQIPVVIRFASRFSLWIQQNNDGTNGNGHLDPEIEKFDFLTIEVNGKSIQTGPCLAIESRSIPDRQIRITPTRSIYDFEKLFSGSRIITVDSALVDLPLVLTYKEDIKDEFVRFVAELTYDLSTYKSTFDEIERELSGEPVKVAAVVRSGVLESMSDSLLDYLEERYEQLKTLTRDYTQEEHEHHGFYFRKQLWNVILSAPIMTRTNLKPRGYIGDSEMMQMIYRNDFEGTTIFGQIVHKHAIGQPAADAVRNRRHDLPKVLREFATAWKRTNRREDRLAVLSVACGPAMELDEVFKEKEDVDLFSFSLLDQDNHALQEAANVIEGVERRHGNKVSVNYIRDSVRTMLFTKELKAKWGQFHFIYSMGLFDYLSRPVASAVIKKLYNLLLPGGEMIIGNFFVENPTMIYMAYWMDWTILYRTEEDMLALAEDLEGATASIERDATGIQLFLKIRKAAG